MTIFNKNSSSSFLSKNGDEFKNKLFENLLKELTFIIY